MCVSTFGTRLSKLILTQDHGVEVRDKSKVTFLVCQMHLSEARFMMRDRDLLARNYGHLGHHLAGHHRQEHLLEEPRRGEIMRNPWNSHVYNRDHLAGRHLLEHHPQGRGKSTIKTLHGSHMQTFHLVDRKQWTWRNHSMIE